MRAFNFLLAILFLVLAFLQVNDENPVVWILIYGAMSVVCIMAAFEFYNRMLLAILAVLVLALGYYVNTEKSAELLCLLFSLLLLIFYTLRSLSRKSS